MNRYLHPILTAICGLLFAFSAWAAPQIEGGLIVIETETKDVAIYVDGTAWGKFAPDYKEIAIPTTVGKHSVEIRKSGMQTDTHTVEIARDGETIRLVKIQLKPEPPFDFSKILNPRKDSFETPEQFAARVQKDIAEFNRHAQEGDPSYRVAWLLLDKEQYHVETGFFVGIVQWNDPVRDWGSPQFTQASLTAPKDKEQIEAFWNTGEASPPAKPDQAKKDEHRFPLFVTLKRQGEKTELAQILVRGLEKQWMAKAEQNKIPVQVQAANNCPECPEMVKIPSLGISVGKYEVTQGQWKAVMGYNPSKNPECGDKCPVEYVSWNDVQSYIEALNKKSGKNYRLPTEKEWEAACRAGGQHVYCGADNAAVVALYHGNAEYKTHSVGSKIPNAFGLYDMSGNVSEWTSDCWDGMCSSRAIRGGSYVEEAKNIAFSFHAGLATSSMSSVIGFRLVHN